MQNKMNQAALESLVGITEKMIQFMKNNPSDPDVLKVSSLFLSVLRDYEGGDVAELCRAVTGLKSRLDGAK